jgi:hypothetical protein
MSELIGIDENNCVLEVDELYCIDLTFERILNHTRSECKLYMKDRLNVIFLKINKLNELAKERQEESK